MKFFKISSYTGTVIAAGQATRGCLAAVLAVSIGLSWATVISQAQPADNDAPGAQVLTRGPVHEAFAGMVTFNPEAGVTVTKAPPDIIEELPPEERPEGDNVAWIPGYWGWDDERNDFLWVSGTWRALPPGREWLAGYWAQTPRGYQWTSGYWADTTVRETTYLPPPPVTVEVGPNIAAPSSDYGWTPGCWVWYQGHYAWRPGYWAQCRADWDWIPSYYSWTPRGYLFVGGFWDYPVARRGVVFAPVYFEPAVYARRGYVYSPTIVISLGVFSDHLFLRPSYQHYYFGDYYAPRYAQVGFYASFSFQSSRHGYDPFYSHQRWEHRQDRDWERRVEASYQYRRDNEAARPPRTWAAQRTISPTIAESDQNRMRVAAPIDQVAKRKDSKVRFQPVAREERQQLAKRGQEVQKSREQRRTLEAKATGPIAQKPGEISQPAKVQIPRSPIVAKPVNQLSRNQAPPAAQQAPKPDLKRQPKSEAAGPQPKAEQSNPQAQPQPRQVEPKKRSAPGQNESPTREKPTQPDQARKPGQSQKPTPNEAQPSEKGLEKLAQPEAERRTKAPTSITEDSQPDVRGQNKKAQPVVEQRTQALSTQRPAESRQNDNEPEMKARQGSAPSVQPRPAVSEKGAAKLLRKDHPKQGKGRPAPPDYPPATPPTSK
jgi:hypothetical protein